MKIPEKLRPIQFQYEHPSENVFITERSLGKYTIDTRGRNSGIILDRQLNEVYEPSPSSRTDVFIESTRFTLEEAALAVEAYISKIDKKSYK